MMFAGLEDIKAMWGPGLECPTYVKDALDVVEGYMRVMGINYVATERPHVYNGAMYNVAGSWAWEHEASAQHNHCFYMFQSGIALDVIRSGLGAAWSPPPGDGGCD